MNKGKRPSMRKAIDKMCKAEGCDSVRVKNGYCNKHHLRMKRYGRLHRVRREKGSGTNTSHGYVTVACKYQHRIVAQRTAEASERAAMRSAT